MYVYIYIYIYIYAYTAHIPPHVCTLRHKHGTHGLPFHCLQDCNKHGVYSVSAPPHVLVQAKKPVQAYKQKRAGALRRKQPKKAQPGRRAARAFARRVQRASRCRRQQGSQYKGAYLENITKDTTQSPPFCPCLLLLPCSKPFLNCVGEIIIALFHECLIRNGH